MVDIEGDPRMFGRGSLLGGTLAELLVEHADPGAIGVLVIGLSRIDLPFAGGTMVPALDVLIPGSSVAADGTAYFAGTWPDDIPSGTEVFFQSWLADPAGPKRRAATNALSAATP
jgi:hypothetical protein